MFWNIQNPVCTLTRNFQTIFVDRAKVLYYTCSHC
jgi:hypothetical protein